MRSIISKNPKVFLIASCLGVVLIFTAAYQKKKPIGYHTGEELNTYRVLLEGDLPNQTSDLFIGSGKCAGCHGIDPNGIANLDDEGNNVSPSENWRATMMANSSKDPFWRAKVAHETSVNPGHAAELVNKCTSCHAPLGRFEAAHDGIEFFDMATLDTDSLANDGVSCMACHSQQIEGTGNFFSGELTYNADTVWGPVFDIAPDDFPMFSSAMQSFVGVAPVAHEKFAKSETCAGCHSLITNTADLEGNATGTTFIEQATYHEWLNSTYNLQGTQEGECQGCHMPRLDQPVVVASGYLFLEDYPRQPFGQHFLVGGNSFMLELMKNRIGELGLTANETHFNTVIDRTIQLLQQNTADIEVTPGTIDGDTARYTVKINNKVGHKFPSGYPSRRAYVEFIMTDAEGNEIFHSGALQPNFEVNGQDAVYEPHYDLISQNDQVQIYEMVMGDVNGNPTTVLERAHHMLKDNRLVPLGFTTQHAAYDSTMIVGAAANDPNFNWLNGIEGSGTDEIKFHIPVSGVNGEVHVTARLMYQSLPPKWMEEMFAVDHETINAFEEMYTEEGADPVQVAMDEVNSNLVGIGESSIFFQLGPNPTSNGQIRIQSGNDRILEVRIYDITGKLIVAYQPNQSQFMLRLPDTPGSYLVDIRTTRGRRAEKVLRTA
jgi:Cytochrome c554 and c-prime